ncbi:MAG TPA: acyl-CoA thioesterase [Planctomycetota bacterium]|nr:acyl-CoA thioesterase [Planctomycetota bacterium]
MSQRERAKHAITIEQKIGLHHCDPLGVAWHGRYFEWFEAARTELFASLDLDVPQIRAFGYRMYIVDAHCRYMAPLAYGDTARITAWFVATEPLIRVAYEVHNAATARWSARATTVLATTTHDGTLLATTPPELLGRLPAR